MSVNTFSSALQVWSESNSVSVRALGQEAELASGEISNIRSGKKGITFESLCKLLPAIERLSTRSHARTLLVAYLNDETPPEFAGDVRVYAVDETTGAVDKDAIAITRDRWEARARSDATFATWWLTSDGYMHEADTEAVDARAIKYQAAQEGEIALVAETAREFSS